MDKNRFVEILLIFGIVALFGLNYYNPKQEYKLQNVTIVENESERYHMKVFGTEYLYGEVATTFLQLLDDNYEPVYNATCWINAYYPNNSVFIDDAMMARFKEGLYYYDYVVPNISGIYMLTTRCFIPTFEYELKAVDFAALSNIKEEVGTYYNTHEVDNVYHMITGTANYLDVYYNISNAVNTSNITDIQAVMFYKVGQCTNCVNMYVYNFINQTWELLPNAGSGAGVSSDSPELVLSNSIACKDDKCIDENSVIMIRITTTTSSLYVDYIGVEIIAGATQYTNLIALRGSGEVHVHEPPQAELNVSGVNVSAEVEWPPEIRWAS